MRPTSRVASTLLAVVLFALTSSWCWAALVVANYGRKRFLDCGADLPYEFLDVIAIVGIVAGYAGVWLGGRYATSGGQGRAAAANTACFAALLLLWAMLGGLTGLGCGIGA